jgi:thioredoxin-related protein
VSKEPNETLVMTTCKCRENTKNLVMTRPFLEDVIKMKVAQEQKRIIELLMDLNAVRRCAATNKLVSFDLNGEKVIYLPGVETND